MNTLPTGLLILIIVLAVLLLAAVFIGVWAFTEPYILKVTTRKMYACSKDPEFKKQVVTSDNSSRKPDLRLFFFSDLHAELCRIKPERLIAAILEAHAADPLDAVVFGGDICNLYKSAAKGLAYLKQLSAALSDAGIPFYGVTGNHDLEFDPSGLKCHFKCIENEQINFTSHVTGKPIVLTGVDDTGRLNRVWHKVPPVPSDAVSVLVAHNPDVILHFEEDAHVDFMLSGHFHAGQIKLPFRLEFVKIRSDVLPRRGVIEGVFEHNGTTFFISRGLGCNALPVRLGAKPEASVIEIYA